MINIHNYFYFSNNKNELGIFDKQQPVLLNFSSVQNGRKEETCVHNHSYIEIFYFTSGEGVIEFDNKILKLKANDFLIIDAGISHIQYSTNDNFPLDYYCICIDNIKISDGCLNKLTDKGYCLYSFQSNENYMLSLLNNFLKEFKEKKDGYILKIQSYTNELFIETIRLFSFNKKNIINYKKNNKVSNLVKEIKYYIENNYYKELDLDYLSKVFFYSKSYILHQFKNYYDISPLQYLISIRVENAKILLQQTTLSISEIALKVGFNNPTYFSETFTKLTEKTPTSFRKEK